MKIKKILPLLIPITCLIGCNKNNSPETKTVYLDYGNYIVRPVSVKVGDEYTPPSDPVSKLEYDFNGWYLNPDFSSSLRVSGPIKIVDDVYLYAKYSIKTFSIIYYFESEDAPFDVDVAEAPYGSYAPYKDMSNYKYAATCFKGWYIDREFKTKFKFYNTKIYEHTIIYGNWVEQ